MVGMAETSENEMGLSYAIADGQILQDGIVLIAFGGEHLQVYAKQILGWKPVGVTMEVSGVYESKRGDVVVKYIDGKPAAGVYEKYLRVKPDEHFLQNVSDFPLLLKRNGTLLARGPYMADKQGYLHFWADFFEGEKVQLSYANTAAILVNDRLEAERVKDFDPQALCVIICANRYTVMGDVEQQEMGLFSQALSSVHFTYGGFEILRIGDYGGIFNSVMVIIGMKETDSATYNCCRLNNNANEHIELDLDSDGPIPVYLRLTNFMDAVTWDLWNLASDAAAANKAKSAFLSNMSHEIRTPINAVLGMDEMILWESREKNILKYAEDIRSAGNNLLGIVNDVLDFSKIEAGKMDIIPVEYELSSVINDLYNMIRKRAEDKGLELRLEVDPNMPHLLYGDEIRIKQVITNILTNAVKYTNEGRVTLSISSEKKKDDKILLRVGIRDTGIGIKKEDLKKLFSAFDRIEEKRNRTIEGTGLGMSITQRLLGLMGSRLHVRSEYNKGSEFFFELEQKVVGCEPIGDFKEALARSIASRKAYRESFKAPAARILVVDDTVMNLTVIRNLLKKTKVLINTAESGFDMLDLIREQQYDLIFLDHRMPEMDGIETLKRMKALAPEEHLNSKTPVIALTANAVSGAREEYLSHGFDDYLTKPINSAQLEQMMIDYLPEDKVELTDGAEDQGIAAVPDIYWQIPELDVQKGFDNCGDGESFVSAVRIYQESAEDNIEEIREALLNKDYKAYTVKVHALKSSSRIIGANAIGNLAERMEKAGNEGDIEAIEKNTMPLLGMYSRLAAELAEPERMHAGAPEAGGSSGYVGLSETGGVPESGLPGIAGEPGAGGASGQDLSLPEIEPEALAEAYSAMREIAGMFDYDSMMSVLEELKNYRVPEEEWTRLKQLGKAARKHDWDKVQELLK